MLTEIAPIYKNTFSCKEAAIASVLSWLNRDFILMFAESWGFKHLEKDKNNPRSLGERINPDKGSSFKFIEKYHGICITKHRFSSSSEIISLVHKEIQKGLPVCLFIDAYYAPWDLAYERQHNMHFCLAVGADDAKEELICDVPYYQKKAQCLPYKLLEKGFGVCMTFEKSSISEIEDGWKEIVCNSANRVLQKEDGKNSFDYMRSFADEVSTEFDIDDELNHICDLSIALILMMLSRASWGRKNHAEMLRCLSEQTGINILMEYAKQMDEASINWDKIKLLFTKALMIKNKTLLKNIAEHIRDLSIFEEKLASRILEETHNYKKVSDY